MRSFLLRLAIFLFLPLSVAQAEYRVFLLNITDEKNEVLRSFKSTLDPEQYVSYYPLRQNERVSYVETWMCWSRTSYLELCDNPKQTPPSVETEDLTTPP